MLPLPGDQAIYISAVIEPKTRQPLDYRTPLRRGRRLRTGRLVAGCICLLSALGCLLIGGHHHSWMVPLLDPPPKTNPFAQKRAEDARIFKESACCSSFLLQWDCGVVDQFLRRAWRRPAHGWIRGAVVDVV